MIAMIYTKFDLYITYGYTDRNKISHHRTYVVLGTVRKAQFTSVQIQNLCYSLSGERSKFTSMQKC